MCRYFNPVQSECFDVASASDVNMVGRVSRLYSWQLYLQQHQAFRNVSTSHSACSCCKDYQLYAYAQPHPAHTHKPTAAHPVPAASPHRLSQLPQAQARRVLWSLQSCASSANTSHPRQGQHSPWVHPGSSSSSKLCMAATRPSTWVRVDACLVPWILSDIDGHRSVVLSCANVAATAWYMQTQQ
jgi:hypothetical protein